MCKITFFVAHSIFAAGSDPFDAASLLSFAGLCDLLQEEPAARIDLPSDYVEYAAKSPVAVELVSVAAFGLAVDLAAFVFVSKLCVARPPDALVD
jgi:hypothetical protein